MTVYQEKINSKVISSQNNQKINALKNVKELLIPQLLDDTKTFKAILKRRSYSFDKELLFKDGWYTESFFDESILTINDIKEYFEPMGLIVTHDEALKIDWLEIDPYVFTNYIPKYITYSNKSIFGLITHNFKEGISEKDRIKDYVLNMYGSYSIDELEQIFVMNAKYNDNLSTSKLVVSQSDDYYFSMLKNIQNLKHYNIEIIKGSAIYCVTLI